MEMKARFDVPCACCKVTIRGGSMVRKLDDKLVDGLRIVQWAHAGECPAPAVVVARLESEARTMTKAEAKASRVVPAAPAAPAKRPGRPSAARAWRPCGYPGCSPFHCDSCQD